MKKLIYLVTEDWYFVSHRLPLACAAKDEGYDVVIVTQGREHGNQITEAGLHLEAVDFSRSHGKPWQDLKTLIAIYKIYKRHQPDLVHHVSLKPVIYGSVAAFLVGVPAIVNALTGLGFVFSSAQKKAKVIRALILPLLKFLLTRKNSWLIVQNLDDQKTLEDAGITNQQRSVLIKGSGVDTHRFNIENSDQPSVPIVVLAARMLWDKGVGEFVKAAEIVHSSNPDVRFVLVGDSDLENPSCIPSQTLSNWQKSGIIEWWGKRTDMPDILMNATLVCLPSYREGLPKVLIEAAACGKAIITTDAPGCREIVRHGVNGLTVPVGDSQALAEAILKLLKDEGLRNQMGKKGREIVEQEFTIEKVCSETLHLYSCALSRNIKTSRINKI
jgi:glycosyltransferase involved in cell wall biosynthesis